MPLNPSTFQCWKLHGTFFLLQEQQELGHTSEGPEQSMGGLAVQLCTPPTLMNRVGACKALESGWGLNSTFKRHNWSLTRAEMGRQGRAERKSQLQ